MMKHKCFSIGSQNSAGMCSDNPMSGIYETDIGRTLDNTCCNPGCWQGGIAVVEIDDPENRRNVDCHTRG